MKDTARETGAEMKDRLKSSAGDFEGRVARKSEDLRNQAGLTREQIKAEMPEGWKRRDRRFTDSPREIRRHLESRKDSAVDSIKNVEKKAVDEVKEFGEHLSKTAQDVKEGLGASAHDVKEGASERWQEFKGKLAEAPKTVVEEGEYIGKVVKEKAAAAGEKIKETAMTAEEKAKNLIRPAKETVDQGVERAREVKNRATDEFKREANYARDKSADAWEQGRKEAQTIKNKTARAWEENKDSAGAAVGGVVGKVVQEAEEFGSAVKNTAKDVKEGLSGQHPAPKRVGGLAGIGEAINRAFESTPDTNRSIASDAGVPVSANLPREPVNFGHESEVRKTLRERVLEEEQRSPGFVEGLVRFVFGPSRHPDLGDSKLSDAERTSVQVARVNTVAYSPAGTITPDELEEVGVYPTATPKDKLTYPANRKAPDTRVEFDPEAARVLDRISSIQYSPAMGAPYDYVKEVSAKERETGGRARSYSLPSSYTVPESARSSYFQTFRPYMNTNEVEERVLESTIDFFY
jgi:vacuolar-type H+-ATPase subunit H